MSNPIPSLRRAEECDIPAILALLLTSFRQFPLFTFLYAPLDHNKDAAHDTIFFWRRRLLLDLLDPTATILVAEAPESFPATTLASGDDLDEIEKESWKMLEWVTRKGKLSQSSGVTAGKLVVGFAIWRRRPGRGDEAAGGNEAGGPNWCNCLRSSYYLLYHSVLISPKSLCSQLCRTKAKKGF
jgi:hypothetical protein